MKNFRTPLQRAEVLLFVSYSISASLQKSMNAEAAFDR